jgi:hypothetical protein
MKRPIWLHFLQNHLWLFVIGVFIMNMALLTFIYLNFRQEVAYINTQFDALSVGVKEGEQAVDHLTEIIETLHQNLDEILADKDEAIFENFWGDTESATHLQSMKYLGYYIFNGQMVAHTKSIQGNRYLNLGEKLNEEWRVKEISKIQITLEGNDGKTFIVQKEFP